MEARASTFCLIFFPHYTIGTSSRKDTSRLPVHVLPFALVLLISLATPTSSCTEQDKTSLLQFLDGLSHDAGLAKSWQEEASDCCKWEGVTCNRNKTVIEVSLEYRGLAGRIAPSLGNLTGLQHLNLSYNSLSGGLPLGLVSSSSIMVLDVSFNQLSGDLNEFPSSIPGQPLQVLNLSSNLFTGQFISTTWKTMQNLIALNASNNSFTGQIPSHFCNISPSFAVLELGYNKLSGSIPPGLGNCSMLRVLKADHNYLTGTLPDELFKATSLEHLSFASNSLQGMFSGTHIVKLHNLFILDIGENKFSGNIPESIGQLKRLQELHLYDNGMSGELPSALSNCRNLITIDLKNNNFWGELAKVNFSNLPNLETLDLMHNNFSGTIPESIYSCSNLTALRLSSNNPSPSYHLLTTVLKNSKNLTTLLIGKNFMQEMMMALMVLSLSECSLSGEIPHWLSKLRNLEMLFLNGNQLTGPLPDWIGSLNFLFYLDISNNNLTGEIPTALPEMSMLKSEKTAALLDTRVFELPVYVDTSLQYRKLNAFQTVLNLGNNNFIGVIPPEIGLLKELNSLNLSLNKLYGDIPQSIGNLTNLLLLDLSSNNLTGPIPAALNNLHFLSEFNVSYNDLEGPVSTTGQLSTFTNSSFGGNPKLCGPMLIQQCSSAGAPSTSKNHHNKTAIFALAFGVFAGGIIILLVLARILVLFWGKIFRIKNRSANDSNIETPSFNSNSEYSLVMMPGIKGDKNKLMFTDIVKATNNFGKENIIGCGGFGLVFKAELPDGSKLAIKKLDGEMCLMEREFTAEVETLSMAYHENLVPLWGYCVHGNSRFLIYSFMENGSLDDWLHNRDDDASIFVDWPTRLKIAQGASRGLSYIHNVCKPHIVHRDIKSSNILLDKEFKACVADFGLSRLILQNKTHVTTELVGTLGYIPPEYAHGWVATLRGDIYSFGVVLLEMLTGTRPISVLSTSKELVPWVMEMRSQGKQIEVMDPSLLGTGHEDQMLEMLEVSCKCVNHNPSMRPPIMEVVSYLESIDAGLQTQKSVKTVQLVAEFESISSSLINMSLRSTNTTRRLARLKREGLTV
ncbi:hypothetical protein U9M48_025685 [Paspalum notatum var. saurae]|uniref:non-specific serine/threonine protein kinase n=1 Tax=Paspalum notatum var. saurae TaxID=547442 RepID=A0AAQ3TR85_PASNO